MSYQKVSDIEIQGKNVFLRLDLNVPMNDGIITDETRLIEALPTIRYIYEKCSRMVIASHWGRPKGKKDPAQSLKPVAQRLSELLEQDVIFVDDYYSEPADQVMSQMGKNKIMFLENLRFDKGEESNDTEFAQKLMKGISHYVDDAFGAVHRAHASIVAAAELVPPQRRAMGFLIEKEIKALEQLQKNPASPFVVIMGGAKVSDKIGIILNLINVCNHLIIGGAMAYTFLAQKGIKVGKSRIEEDKFDLIDRILQKAAQRGVHIHLPVDHICAQEFSADSYPIEVSSQEIPESLMGLDIGPKTLANFVQVIGLAKSVLWNGPMGVFEWDGFSKGSLGIAHAMASSAAFTVVGGGDSAAVAQKAGVSDRLSHVSTGGGASLEFLEGASLPGLSVLEA